jgi:hypothetical protein
MAATGWLIRRVLRQRWTSLVPLALVVALGGAGALAAVGAAERTAGAYAAYLTRAQVGEVVINPSLNTAEMDTAMRDLPGVRGITSSALFFASVGDWEPVSRGEMETATSAQGQVSGSVDGRFEAMDRPVLADGRFPTGDGEVLVNVEMAEAQGLAVGDSLPVTFWRSRDDQAAADDDVIVPVGVELTRVVGIATLSDEVLPDGLFPRERVIVSPALARRYDCLPDHPPATASHEQAIDELFPAGCSTSYRYYSLDLARGDRGVAAVLDAARRRIADANATLPRSLRENPDSPTYYMVATSTAGERERVERSTQPIVTALAVLAVAAGAVTAVVLALGVARELRHTADDQRQWRRLGLSRRQHVAVVAVPLGLAVAAGVVTALAVAWALSPLGPVGSVRSIEPSPGRELSGEVAHAALVLAAVCLVGVSALAVLAAFAARHGGGPEGRRDPAASRGRAVLDGLGGLGGLGAWMAARPDIDQGVRAAYRGARGRLVVASCAAAAGTFLAAAVFGASLSALLTTPASYGWPWDLGVMTGFGYGDLDRRAAARVLDGHPDVETWTEFGFTNETSLDGESVPAVVAPAPRRGADFAVVEGRLPRGDDEVALGARTAAERGLGPGDDVALSVGGVDARRATVTGIAVLPPIGQFQADRTAPGTGMVVPLAFAPEAASLITFAGIDLAADADADAVFAALHDEFVTWDLVGTPPVEYREPVRPAEIVNVQSMRAIPLLVGGFLAATAVVGLTVAVLMSVRSRQRELAVLAALGFTPRQVRTSVRAQAVATMLAGLLVGAPLGIAAGRLAWRAFASQLGVLTDPSTPGWWIAATLAASLAVTLGAAAVPARLAGRITPASTLRAE